MKRPHGVMWLSHRHWTRSASSTWGQSPRGACPCCFPRRRDRDCSAPRCRGSRLGALPSLAELERHPHPLLARLRESEPVAWVPALNAWLVTRRDLALQAMRSPDVFTVDDPRFSTGRVVGRSMLTTEGEEHARHRAPFAQRFRLAEVRERFSQAVAREVDRLIDAFELRGAAELRAELAGPLAAAIATQAVGLGDPQRALGWYRAIVHATTE